MADENGDVGQAKLEDSNIAGIGSQENRDLRKEAAASDPEFKGAGEKPGLEIWRVENRRTENDTPDFGVKRWPKSEYGNFFSGDSYIVLNTYRVKDPETGKLTDALAWDVHFWLGEESSQDEIGVAAYKTVEIDDLLDDGPIQHREVQGHESKTFQSYFKEMVLMKGGIASGFRKVKPEEYEPRLLEVRRTKKTVKATQKDVSVSEMNQGDVYILDAGLKVYLWIGEGANAFEKSKGAALQANIINSRLGKAKRADVDDDFWKILGGGPDDVGPEVEHAPSREDASPKPDECKLFRITDSSGSISFGHEQTGDLTLDMLDSNDAFLIDAEIELFVWVGNGASNREKAYVFKFADDYLKENNMPNYIPITSIKEGQINSVFRSCFKY